MAWQLALGLRTDDFPTFEAFVAAGNRETVMALQDAVTGATGGAIYLWGPAGSGKTHLLQAACVGGRTEGIYLPLGALRDSGPEVLEGLESRGTVCLDQVDAAAGEPHWEEALFHLFNRAQGTGSLLLLAGRPPPRGLGVRLPDLRSRIAGALILSLTAPADDVLVDILRSMAGRRGLRISDEALRYLVSRERRELGHLAEVMRRLDAVSLACQRRVTIPLIKAALGGEKIGG